MSEMRKVRDLVSGDVIDLEGSAFVADMVPADQAAVDYEYVVVESINGGWCDWAAGEGEVVLYSTTSLSEPMVLPADTEVSWIQNEETA